MSTITIYRPGEITPVSGQYAEVTAGGVKLGREITSVKGHPFPPTQKGGYGYTLADATQH